MLSSCGGSGGAGNNDAESNLTFSGSKDAANSDSDKLWTMLSGYWKTSMPGALNVFYYFGFDDDQKPIRYIVWYHENDETEYVTHVEKLSDNRFKVTFEVPANEEEGLHEVHEGYTTTVDIDVSRVAENVITMISSSGISSEWKLNSKTADERTFDTFMELPMDIDAADFPKVTGNIVKSLQYEDYTGQNLVLFTETDVVEKPCPDCPLFPSRSKGLYAYRFLVNQPERTFQQVWQVTDFVRDCIFYEMGASFIEDAIRITDLNNNGEVEIWMVYVLTCRGDTSPKTMKIIMYEGGRKYAVRGETRSLAAEFEDGKKEYAGGEYTLDPAFNAAPYEFVSFAKELWEAFKNQ